MIDVVAKGIRVHVDDVGSCNATAETPVQGMVPMLISDTERREKPAILGVMYSVIYSRQSVSFRPSLLITSAEIKRQTISQFSTIFSICGQYLFIIDEVAPLFIVRCPREGEVTVTAGECVLATELALPDICIHFGRIARDVLCDGVLIDEFLKPILVISIICFRHTVVTHLHVVIVQTIVNLGALGIQFL